MVVVFNQNGACLRYDGVTYIRYLIKIEGHSCG